MKLLRNLRLLYFFLLFTGILPVSSALLAQKETKATGPKLITSFSFIQLYGGVIIVKATVDSNTDTLNFILDTGSGGISLDSASALALGIPTKQSERTIRGIAGVKRVQFAYNHRLNLPGLSVDSLDFHINDYEMLSGVYGMKVDGIIGYSFLRRFIIQINFDEHKISVFSPGEFPYAKGGTMLRPAISALPMQFAYVNENREIYGRFFLDTGAGLCLLLSQQVVKDSAIFNPDKSMYSAVAEGLGGKTNMNMTVVKRFKLGKYRFKKMPVYIFDDIYNVTSYPFLAGLIGNDLLRRFNLTINYSRSEFYLMPNKSFREPFDYAYTGFNIFQEDGHVIVIDVMENSPAEKAGLKEGDIVVSIGNKFGGNLQDYKTELQQPGNQLRMVISRDGLLDELKLHIGNISKNRKD